ncbi:MAG: TRC40/GET3/ArsA family transport-energizing ATPase [Deltaproteobacteria bacterium]|nr:TRC40/GET3/ArsA family transport-energizing ATPase [Deltaproteobacteria bacterium]
MRILLYAGKGGVGKTSVAGATGAVTARNGLRTLILSLDPAHSLSDVFDLDRPLMDKNGGLPIPVAERLWIQELDVHEEIGKHWGEVHRYLSVLLNASGLDGVLAEELAVLPGMEEVAALLYVNQYAREKTYDVIILDCAPTAESIRFISLPKTLEWYMQKVFRLERNLMRVMRPMARRISDVPLPEDDYFTSIERLFEKLQGVDHLLTDPAATSVRLVTNLEKMVLRETQRAFMFFSLHQLTIDAVVLNRVFTEADGPFARSWLQSQREYRQLAESYFHPTPCLEVPFYRCEVLGYGKLFELGQALFAGRDPAALFSVRPPLEFTRLNGSHAVRIHLPFVQKSEIDLTKVGEELIIRMGNFKRNLILPRAFVPLAPQKAELKGEHLTILFGERYE